MAEVIAITNKDLPKKISLLVLGVALLVLVGWWLQLRVLTSILPGLPSMKANTALGFILLGGALYLREMRLPQTRWWKLLALLSLVFASLLLSQFVFNLNLGIDQALFPDNFGDVQEGLPGRTSAPTAVAFVLLALAMLTENRLKDRHRQTMILVVLLLGLSVFFSYPFSWVYGTSLFSYTGMALHTSVLIVLLAAIMLLEMKQRGWVDLILANNAIGQNTRNLLAAALVTPFLLGWLIFWLQSRGVLQAGLASSSYAVLVMLFLGAVIVLNAVNLQTAETSQRLLRSNLASTQQQFNALVQNSPSAIILKSTQGQYQMVNLPFEKLVGLPADQVIGRIAEDIFSSELLPKVLLSDQQVLSSKQVVSFEAQARLEGEKRSYLCTKFPMFDANGDLVSIGAIWTDITEQKKLAEHLGQKNEELERSNKELEQFAYVASHDLQEPLRMVSSYMQLLESRYRKDLDGDALDFINYAVDGAQRMQRLIQDLLSFSRVGTQGQPPEPVDARQAVDDALQNLKVRIEETGAKITIADLPQVVADKNQLAQVFQNLVANAIKFRGEAAPKIRISASQVDGFAEFSIKDNGIGFDAKYTDRIFVIFQRLNSRELYEGTGIGLAICKKIVERHSGRIWVESKPGKGSQFFFTFPLVPELPPDYALDAQRETQVWQQPQNDESAQQRADRML
ncbi:MAG: PAS domain-containing protein [Anaerolineales bacterium]|nr:PAS domain-containing protein [Anaerolineales bacterium]